jgi:NAD(P)H-flavin reductase/ferredoxin
MGVHVSFGDKKFTLKEDESVLDCLLREQQNIPFSCKSGACQACIMKLVDGEVPLRAQYGLKPSFKQQKLFLSCQCFPDADLSVQLPSAAALSVNASIIEKSFLNHNVIRLRLRPESPLEYLPGQYITVTNPDQVIRSYSIANKLARDGYVEFHIRVIPNGKMSNWLKDHAKTGDQLSLRGPAGDCFYLPDLGKEYPIVLTGTGTGLAPLYGIIIDALEQGHKGEIHLYHGALKETDLYFVDELKKLAAEKPNFNYIPCIFKGEEGASYRMGNIEDIVLADFSKHPKDVRLYLCGAPEMVNSLKTKAFLAGLSPKQIHADSFLPSKENEPAQKDRRAATRD